MIRPHLTRPNVLTVALFLIALVAGGLAVEAVARGIAIAHGDDAGELDAAPAAQPIGAPAVAPPTDAPLVAAPAPLSPAPSTPPAAVAPPAAAAPPAPAGDGVPTGVAHGAALAGLLLGLVAFLRSVLARLEPRPGDPPLDPASWQARTIPMVAAAIALAAAGADVLLGSAPWWTLAPVALTAIAMLWTAIDPPRGSKRQPPASGPTVAAGGLVSLALAGALLVGCRAPAPGQPSRTQQVIAFIHDVRDVAAELGLEPELLCEPAVLAEARPSADHPLLRAFFDHKVAKLCAAPAVP